MEDFDIALSFDTTGSMFSCIDTVKSRMRNIMRKLMADIPGIRLAVVAHGDYDTDHTYVIKYKNFTDDVERLCEFVGSAEGTGGGKPHLNMDEAYELSLNYCRRYLSWRSSANRVFVMIGDRNPHGPHYHLNKQRIDWREEICLLRNKDVKIYAVQCKNNGEADYFYQTIASQTFGHHVSLDDIKQIEKVLMDICYREKMLLKTFKGPTIQTNATVSTVTTIQPQVVTSTTSTLQENNQVDDGSYNGFLCYKCKVGKPIDEFPPSPITDDCRHAPLECLRCLVKYVQENQRCPDETCRIEVDPDCQNMKFFQALLDTMFVDYNKVIEKQRLAMKPDEDSVMVSTMNGDTEWFPYNAIMTVQELKKKIEGKFHLKPEQQRLIYKDEPLKITMRLKDCGIEKNANISLIVPLYCIPDNLDHVVFDLSWEFPSTNPDFLDATCMAFENTSFVQVIDWNHPMNDYFLKNSVRHSEKNLTGPGAKTGHQTIHVQLKKVPRNITHLYFTLSSWRSPNLSAFHNPSLKFYEASSEDVNLCSTTFTYALSSQAVIMCAVIRTGNEWFIEECGGTDGLANGNAKRYNPIRKKIVELIEKRRVI